MIQFHYNLNDNLIKKETKNYQDFLDFDYENNLLI